MRDPFYINPSQTNFISCPSTVFLFSFVPLLLSISNRAIRPSGTGVHLEFGIRGQIQSGSAVASDLLASDPSAVVSVLRSLVLGREDGVVEVWAHGA
jgi:hypothetical protein